MSVATSDAQGRRPNPEAVKKIEDALSRAGVQRGPQTSAAENPSSVDVRVRWNAYVTDQPQIQPSSAPTPPGGGFSVSDLRAVPEPVVLPRAPELSTDVLLVAAVDAQRQLRA